VWSPGGGTAGAVHRGGCNVDLAKTDPPERSERAIWVDGAPTEPEPVRFDGLEGIRFADGTELRFIAESERARDDNLLLVRSKYRHLFGSFSGALPGLELESALGVMESHQALW
jgi:hypothetical protein